MGGIYIPDVSLPGDGDFELWIAIKKDGSFTYNVSGGWRDGNQKAVPIPPHGRLIDADAISYKKIMYDDDDFYYGVTMPYIGRMPTIIPAEEGE